jgi:hypothetical protein
VQIANACALFKSEDQKDRKFAYLHCWKILKDKPKWMERRKEIGCAKKTSNKKQKTVANSSHASVAAAIVPAAPLAGGANAEPSARPDGKKKEKQKLRQRSTIEAVDYQLWQRSTIEAVDYLMAKKKEGDLEKDLKRGATTPLLCGKKGPNWRKKSLSSKETWKRREFLDWI